MGECKVLQRRGFNKSNILESWLAGYRSMDQLGLVTGGRVVAMWVGWSGNRRGGTAVGMISCDPSLTSVSGYEGFHMFMKLSLTNECTEDPFLFLSMPLNIKLELLD